jgi:hypothetical protein
MIQIGYAPLTPKRLEEIALGNDPLLHQNLSQQPAADALFRERRLDMGLIEPNRLAQNLA